MDKLKHDASISTKAIVYQFYIALEKCFDLLEGEKVFIETFGDVTHSNNEQIEVKNYKGPLTDLHENIWKTLDNWLDESFDISHYKHLVLLTTQSYGVQSSFNKWNNKNKDKKKKVLDDIACTYSKKKKKSETTKNIINSVLDNDRREKLLNILEMFTILDSMPSSAEHYQNLLQKQGSVVLSANREDYINALMGFIISPPVTSKISWEISYKDFISKKQSLISEYHSKTIIFPKCQLISQVSKSDKEIHKRHLFVKKIEDINYSEVKNEAIADFISTRNTITNELSKYSIEKHHYDNYEDEVVRAYSSRYRTASRNTNSVTKIKDSKDFYDNVIEAPAPTFLYFNDTPRFFRNGSLHNLADDINENLIWELKVGDDE